jgi:hypothetical protein
MKRSLKYTLGAIVSLIAIGCSTTTSRRLAAADPNAATAAPSPLNGVMGVTFSDMSIKPAKWLFDVTINKVNTTVTHNDGYTSQVKMIGGNVYIVRQNSAAPGAYTEAVVCYASSSVNGSPPKSSADLQSLACNLTIPVANTSDWSSISFAQGYGGILRFQGDLAQVFYEILPSKNASTYDSQEKGTRTTSYYLSANDGQDSFYCTEWKPDSTSASNPATYHCQVTWKN